MALTWPCRDELVECVARCRCRTGNYPADDPHGRTWWQQITSDCEAHWPLMTWGQKIRILINEGYRFGNETIGGGV